MEAPLIIAHRTCPLDEAENSIAGLRRAAALGADGVEIDLRMTLDQRAFLMHDWTLRRMTGFRWPIELTPAAVVRRLKLIASDGRVPSLADALDALPPGLILAVDVKTPWAVVPLMSAIRRRGLDERTLVWCTSALAVRYAVRQRGGAEVAYLKTAPAEPGKGRFLAKARRLGADAVSAHWSAIDADYVAAAHALGLKVYSYHEGYELTADKLRAGLDGLITDLPRAARAAYEALTATGPG